VALLQKSKLIEFYTAPEAYAVFHEPDFIKAKIRVDEGIQYWKDHCSFLRKNKIPIKIAAGGLALIACSYLIIHLVRSGDGNIPVENNSAQQTQTRFFKRLSRLKIEQPSKLYRLHPCRKPVKTEPNQ